MTLIATISWCVKLEGRERMTLRTILYILAGVTLVITGVGSMVYLSFNILLQAIGTMGSAAIFGILVYLLFTSVPAFQGVGAWIARGLSFLKSAEKRAVALQIEHNLNSAQEEINSEVRGLIPYPAKVEWVDKPSYLDTEEKVVVIRMREHEENPRNVASAVIDLISKGMIPFSRIYLEKPIQTAVDSTMVKMILLERDESALDYFLTNVLNKRLGEKGVQHYMNIMNNLYGRGLLTRVFLEEVRELGLKLYPTEDQDARRETKEYVEHLNVLATRKRGEKEGANPYIGKKIKVGYLLIADPEKIEMEGDAPYIGYAGYCVEKGTEAIYLLSRGGKNRPAKRLANRIAKICNMKIVNSSEYEDIVDGVTKALCIELRSNKE